MKTPYSKVVLVLALFCLFPVIGYAQRAPINVNLIIDGSSSLAGSRAEIIPWVNNRLDQILVDGDRVTVWSAGTVARVIYSGTINSASDREAVKRSYRELTGSGATADFSGALRQAADIPKTSFSYTLLISASPESLTSVLSGPYANLLRHSKVEAFPGWRALVVGLDIDARVRSSAAAFMR